MDETETESVVKQEPSQPFLVESQNYKKPGENVKPGKNVEHLPNSKRQAFSHVG